MDVEVLATVLTDVFVGGHSGLTAREEEEPAIVELAKP